MCCLLRESLYLNLFRTVAVKPNSPALLLFAGETPEKGSGPIIYGSSKWRLAERTAEQAKRCEALNGRGRRIDTAPVGTIFTDAPTTARTLQVSSYKNICSIW